MDGILDVCRCVICFNPWTREGGSQICSLSRCGHLFCASCIGKWIAKCSTGDSAKCPTCWKEFDLSDVTMLYGCPVVVIDEELRRKKQQLEQQNELLKSERDNLIEKITELMKQMNIDPTLVVEFEKEKII